MMKKMVIGLTIVVSAVVLVGVLPKPAHATVHNVSGSTFVQGGLQNFAVPLNQIGIKQIYSVPAGMRFTLDHISIDSCLAGGSFSTAAVTADDDSAADFLVPVLVGANCWAANHQTQVFLGENRALVLKVNLAGQGGAILVNYSFSGHLDPM